MQTKADNGDNHVAKMHDVAESDSAEWKKEKREADDSRTGQRVTNGQGMVGLRMQYFGLTHWR